MNRIGEAVRESKETQVAVKINLDGRGKADCTSGIGFFLTICWLCLPLMEGLTWISRLKAT